MKDATGELSMTAVAVVAIAGLAAVFTMFIFPQLKTQIASSTYCSQAFGCGSADSAGMAKCFYCRDSACNSTSQVRCNIKNDIKS